MFFHMLQCIYRIRCSSQDCRAAEIKNSNEIEHVARVLSRYRDARRTRILRIRLRLTVRIKNLRLSQDGRRINDIYNQKNK